MKPKTNLYFIALLPPNELTKHISNVKVALANQFNCKEALKTMPHLTLQIPFFQLPFREEIMIEKLKKFASRQSPIMVRLSGFGMFPEHTLYLRLKNPKPVKLLQGQLANFLMDELNFSNDMIGNKGYTPHITVAYRDLKSKFRAAWNIYCDKKFEAGFVASSMFILKHNYSHWEILREVEFRGIGRTMNLFESDYHQLQVV